MKKKPYLICSDLDDTLLTTEKTITEKSQNAIQSLVKNGHYFVLCSGRPYQGLFHYAQQLSLTNVPVIVSNGAAIVWPNLSTGKIEKVITFDIEQSLFCHLYQEVRPYLDACLASRMNRLYTFHQERLPFWIIHQNDLVTLKEGEVDQLVEGNILNATFQVPQKDISAFLQIIQKDMYQSLLFFDWGEYDGIHTYEVSSKEATKGNALLYLSSYYQISHKQTIAFGDARNDLSMLQAASEGVCMQNAPDLIKESCQYQTEKTHNEDGVIDYLQAHHVHLWK